MIARVVGSLRHTISPAPGGSDQSDIRSAREWILSGTLRFILVFTTITSAGSVGLVFTGRPSTRAITNVTLLSFITFITLKRDLSFRTRAASLIVLCYVLSGWLIFSVGPISEIYLLAVPALTGLLFGLRPALFLVALCSFTLFGVGYLGGVEIHIADLEASPLLMWVTTTVNFTFVSLVMSISGAALIHRIETSRTRLQAVNEELRREGLVRKQAEEETARLARAVEQANEIILIGDREGTVTYRNHAFAEATAQATAPTPPGRLQDLQTLENESDSIDRALQEQRHWSGTIVVPAGNDAEKEFDAAISPIRGPDGRVMNFVAVLRDVSHERAMERRLRQSEKLEAIGTLAAGIAHDFNNIIGSILAVAEETRIKVRGTSVESGIISIVGACERARDVVRQMLVFSRQSNLERRPISLTEAIEEALPLLRAAIPSRIEIRKQLAVTGTVMGSQSEIHLILMNLAMNAMQATTEKEDGILEISLTRVIPGAAGFESTPVLSGEAKYLCLSICDEGTGIHKRNLEKIFDPFFTTKRPGEGTGLGLATVHGIVMGLGGEITVQTALGKGTTFRIYLPEIDATPEEKPSKMRSPERGQERILLVDDEKVLLDITRRLLTSLGYQVTAAQDGESARVIFEADPGSFDLVITDLTMPGYNGRDLARFIQMIRPGIPVILTSGFRGEVDAEDLRTQNVTSFLQKPYKLLEISDQVRSALAGVKSGARS